MDVQNIKYVIFWHAKQYYKLIVQQESLYTHLSQNKQGQTVSNL